MPLELTESDKKWRALTYRQYVEGTKRDRFNYENCLAAVQQALFAERQPPQFAHFSGVFADLGIVHLGLPEEQQRPLLYALADKGVRMPCTRFVLRVARPWYAFFEDKAGEFPLLPNYWMEGVCLLSLAGEPLWIGRRHPDLRNPRLDNSGLRERASGYVAETEVPKTRQM